MVFHLFSGLGAARLPLRTVSSIRTYVAVGSRSSPISSPAKKTSRAAQVSATRTNVTKGNSETVDNYPTTANGVEADIVTQSEIINNTPVESIPSSALSLPPLFDAPPMGGSTDWSRSYHGLSTQPFLPEVAEILQAPIDPLDIEVKPGPCLEGMS
jgi:hypothetical protein